MDFIIWSVLADPKSRNNDDDFLEWSKFSKSLCNLVQKFQGRGTRFLPYEVCLKISKLAKASAIP